MATTTPNYGWDVPTSTDYVADGAVAIETLGDDIDASLFGITSGKNVGLVHIGTTNFSGSAAVNVNSVFSSSFANYRIIVTVNTGAGLRMRMRNGSTDSTAGYGGVAPTYYSFSGFDGVQRVSNGSYWDLWTLTSNVAISMDIHSPNLAERTSLLAQSVSDYGSGNVYIGNGGCQINDTTQYNGFTIYPASSTVSGNIRVYGYRN